MTALPNPPLALADVENLRAKLHGSVIVPGEAQYDEARKAWNLAVDQHPAVIVTPHRALDVVEAVRFAHAVGLGIAVQATGHGVSRPADGAMLIITAGMTNVQIDAESKTAWVEAGSKWGPVLEKAQAVGLAPLLGSSPDVGVVGYTLGGGMGWLARKYGMSLDSVRSFEVVTADGQLIRASETETADLFWGLRGGGGALGVITGVEIQLYPVTMVYGGTLIYPIELAEAVFKHFRDWVQVVPDEFTSAVTLMNFPPLPQVPEFLRGKSAVLVRGCFCGPVEQGEALLKEWWLDWNPPLVNMFHPMPFSEVATISNDPEDPMPSMSTNAWIRELSDEAIDILLKHGISYNGSSPIIFTEIRHAGGAIARVSQDNNAFGSRDASLLLQMLGIIPTAEAAQFLEQRTSQVKRELQPYLTGTVYMNFLEGEEKWQRTQDAYSPETYRRLQAIKAKYDPQNTFRFSFNIPPVKA